MQQALDFKAESEALQALVETLDAEAWQRPTLFKGWTLDDVIVHLHFWNKAADLSLTDPGRFQGFLAEVMEAMPQIGLRAFENQSITERGPVLAAAWTGFYTDMADRWSQLDPKHRVKWAGPEMSVRSSITARQMETWAHGLAVFDLFGQDRVEDDRIRNVVVLGVNTFGWSFQVHGLKPPSEMPALALTAPSGEVWRFGEESSGESISGSAVDFCRVVTQTRNVVDTDLAVEGDGASQWMANAQCFAGPPETPPSAGSRRKSR